MKYFSFLIIVLLVFSCKEKNKSNSPTSIDRGEEKTDSISNVFSSDTLRLEASNSNPPIKEFIEFAKLIEEDSWIHDMHRLKKVSYGLEGVKPEYFNNKPFFKVPFKETSLNKVYQIDTWKEIVHEVCPDFDFELFKSTEFTWVYFYRDIEDSDWIEDGIIEQWKFDNEEDAQKALRQMNKLGGRILFFNTRPYFVSHKKHLFSFSTRAMAFSYGQKQVFDKFIATINIDNE